MALHDCTHHCIYGAGDMPHSGTVCTADDFGATYTGDFDQHSADYPHNLHAVGAQGESSDSFNLCE